MHEKVNGIWVKELNLEIKSENSYSIALEIKLGDNKEERIYLGGGIMTLVRLRVRVRLWYRQFV